MDGWAQRLPNDSAISQARVLFNTSPPEDTQTLTQTIDGVAPTATVTAQPLAPGSSDQLVKWEALDDAGGSGVKHVTVYVRNRSRSGFTCNRTSERVEWRSSAVKD